MAGLKHGRRKRRRRRTRRPVWRTKAFPVGKAFELRQGFGTPLMDVSCQGSFSIGGSDKTSRFFTLYIIKQGFGTPLMDVSCQGSFSIGGSDKTSRFFTLYIIKQGFGTPLMDVSCQENLSIGGSDKTSRFLPALYTSRVTSRRMISCTVSRIAAMYHVLLSLK